MKRKILTKSTLHSACPPLVMQFTRRTKKLFVHWQNLILLTKFVSAINILYCVDLKSQNIYQGFFNVKFCVDVTDLEYLYPFVPITFLSSVDIASTKFLWLYIQCLLSANLVFPQSATFPTTSFTLYYQFHFEPNHFSLCCTFIFVASCSLL